MKIISAFAILAILMAYLAARNDGSEPSRGTIICLRFMSLVGVDDIFLYLLLWNASTKSLAVTMATILLPFIVSGSLLILRESIIFAARFAVIPTLAVTIG